jgi:hypothetical protein
MAAVADGCCSAARTDSASSRDMAEERSKRDEGRGGRETNDDDHREWCAQRERAKEAEKRSRERAERNLNSFWVFVAFSRVPASCQLRSSHSEMHANDTLIVGQGCRSTAH